MRTIWQYEWQKQKCGNGTGIDETTLQLNYKPQNFKFLNELNSDIKENVKLDVVSKNKYLQYFQDL